MEIKSISANAVDGGGSSPSWSFDTNWTASNGSLATAVTVESSDSVIASDAGNEAEALDSVHGSHPLILKPPSTDSGPCEIKIRFTQKHEIRQIYVRSTARVYEIYYAPSSQATNEYLCTVRCCTAVRDGEPLQVTNVEDFMQQNTRVSIGEQTERKYLGEATSSTSEDDWIEVKVPGSPLHENAISSLPNNVTTNGRSSIQDLYEATAEISDADPCTSLTIRLLSLQDKACVYVDDVYVFADAVDPSDLESQPVQMGSSTGSALMAMLVPTLMQFSKSSGKQADEKDVSSKMRSGAEVESKSVDPTHVSEKIHRDEKLSSNLQNVKLHYERVEPARVQLPSHDPATDRYDDPSVKQDMMHTRIEGLLEQLVSRVSRVEDFCSRFEENMLKPINNMEARLQRVEQQLEVLSKTSELSKPPPCTRICAPSFSCVESNSSSVYDDSSRQTPPGISGSEKKELPSTDISKQPDDSAISDRTPHFIPSLVITAPEFSCGEEDEDNNFRSSEGTSLEKPNKPFSIDDALAAALSGFLFASSVPHMEGPGTPKASASGCTVKTTENSELKSETSGENAHEVTTGETNKNETEMRILADPKFTKEGADEEHSECVQSPSVIASQCTADEEGNGNGVGPRSIASVVDEQHQSLEAGTKVSVEGDGEVCISGIPRGFEESSDGDFGPGEPINAISSLENDIGERVSGNKVECKCDTPESTVLDAGEGSDRSTILNVTESASARVLDLEFPILDVKFCPDESSSGDYQLEALLYDGALCVEEAGEGVCGDEQANYIFKADDDRAVGDLPSDDIPFLDLPGYPEDVCLSGELHSASTSSNHSMVVSLI